MGNFLAGLLVYVFPREVVAKVVVVLLRKAASYTDSKVDDEVVDVLEKNLGLKDE